jgi:hypothetical protein
MSKLKELLEKIADENLRKELDDEVSAVNREAGERGRKLIEKDTEIKSLKEKVSETSSYSEAFKLLKAQGIDLKEIPKLLDKMKVAKTSDDDLAILTETVKAKEAELSELRSFKKTTEIRTAIGKVLSEEKANFKNDKGEQITVVDRFIPEDKLYADIDVSNEVLLRERVKSVLKDGLQAQEAIRKELGFQGNQTHTIPEGQGGVGQDANLAAQLREISVKQGPAAAFDAILKLSGE